MKRIRTKLTFARETLRRLNGRQLGNAAGGATVFFCTAACTPPPKSVVCMPETYFCPTYTCTVKECSASMCQF